jgi:hypothetical protein
VAPLLTKVLNAITKVREAKQPEEELKKARENAIKAVNDH